MVFTLCSSGAIIRKAGAGVNSSIASSGAFLTEISDQAEQMLSSVMRVNLVANYASYNSNTKKIIEDVVSSDAANQLISYDMGGYSSLAEAQTMLNYNWARVSRGIDLLKEKIQKDFLGAS